MTDKLFLKTLNGKKSEEIRSDAGKNAFKKMYISSRDVCRFYKQNLEQNAHNLVKNISKQKVNVLKHININNT